MPPIKAVINWGHAIIAIIGFGKDKNSELTEYNSKNFTKLAKTTPRKKLFFLNAPKINTKRALPVIIYGIIGKRGKGNNPVKAETILGKNPIKTPAPIPKIAVDKNKIALTIGPVINCCFKKGASRLITRKTIKIADLTQIFVFTKEMTFILSILVYYSIIDSLLHSIWPFLS